MIVYFEGPDGSGKSTVIDKIYNELKPTNIDVDKDGNRLIPTHPDRPGRLNEGALFKVLNYMANSKTVYLVDRGPLSDCIYRMFDNKPAVTTLYKLCDQLNQHINNNKLLLVFCETPNSYRLMMERGDENPVAIQHHQELELLFTYSKTMFTRSITYNFEENSDINYLLIPIKIAMLSNNISEV